LTRNSLISVTVDSNRRLTAAQAADVASHYRIVSVEKCTRSDAGPEPTEFAIWDTAAQLKALDPTIRVLFYIHTDLERIDCYAAYQTFLANPAWWLRDDAGALIFAPNSASVPRMDYTIPAARAWLTAIPLNNSAANAAVIDGVLADQTGSVCPAKPPRLSAARCAEQVEGKAQAMRELQALFDAANGGTVLGNGLSMYPQHADNNWPSVLEMEGTMAEHFAVFESVNADGSLDVPRVAQYINLTRQAALMGKWVVVCTWPGPLDAIDEVRNPGWFLWAGGVTPPGASAPLGWRAALKNNLTFALAGWMTIAEENVWMQYQAGYNGLAQGAVRCPQAPSTCAAPEEWYPELSQPLGAPLGPPVRVGNVYTREFERARSVLDLDVPWRSSVTFFSLSGTPSGTPSPAGTLSGTPSGTPSPAGTLSGTPSGTPLPAGTLSGTPLGTPAVGALPAGTPLPTGGGGLGTGGGGAAAALSAASTTVVAAVVPLLLLLLALGVALLFARHRLRRARLVRTPRRRSVAASIATGAAVVQDNPLGTVFRAV
jgi:hypothetical protein